MADNASETGNTVAYIQDPPSRQIAYSEGNSELMSKVKSDQMLLASQMND